MAQSLRRSEFIKRQQKRKRERIRRRLIALIIAAMLFAMFFIGHQASNRQSINSTVPLLLQTDSRWSSISYGSSTIGISGCAPTCLSMVSMAVTGNQEFTPDIIAKFSEENGYYIEGTGTSWELMTEGAKEFGLKFKELALSEELISSELQKNHPIICSVGPGDFTAEGHFIVLTSYENGAIYLNDPNSESNSNIEWSYEQLAPQINAMWVYK